MFVHNFDPYLIQFSENFGIRWYSLAYLLGFLTVYFLLKKPFAQKHIKGWKKEFTDPYITWLFLGMLIGARFFHVFIFELSFYLQNPQFILAIWRGGLSFHGAIIGLIIANYYFAKKYKLKFFQLADFIALPASLFLVLGRIANFINAEMPGRISSVSWCVKFPNYEGCRHPTQLYEAIKNLFIFGVLYKLRSMKLPEGTIFWSFITLYGLIRFLLMYLRDENVVFLGLTLSQVFSALMFIIGSYFLAKLLKKF